MHRGTGLEIFVAAPCQQASPRYRLTERHSGPRRLALSLVVEAPPVAGLDEAQFPRLPTVMVPTGAVRMGVHRERDALRSRPAYFAGSRYAAPSDRKSSSRGSSHQLIV